jgi:hypothetical protein
MVDKFYCRDYVFYAHVLSTLISALNALLEDEQELGLGMLDMSQTYL